ncbi:MAG: hypothetical protein O2983_10280 [Planctomycetota bacterium]|nr:hypothetical protein [Planctomycetota bacterium]
MKAGCWSGCTPEAIVLAVDSDEFSFADFGDVTDADGVLEECPSGGTDVTADSFSGSAEWVERSSPQTGHLIRVFTCSSGTFTVCPQGQTIFAGMSVA